MKARALGTTAVDGRRVNGATAIGDFGGTSICRPGNPADTPVQDRSTGAPPTTNS